MSLITLLVLLTLAVLPPPASAWNIRGHMLSGAIGYQVLTQENPATIDKVKAVLERHPWYTNQWQARLQEVPSADYSLVLFMQAARWLGMVFASGRPDPNFPRPVTRLTSLSPKHSVIASGGIVCSEVLVCRS